MVYSGPGNFRGIDRGSGFLLVCLIGFQDG